MTYFVLLCISLLTSLNTFTSANLEAPTITNYTTSSTPVNEEINLADLKTTITKIINELLSQVNMIATRIDGLNIQKEIKEKNTHQLLITQEKLIKTKANLSFYVNDRNKMINLLTILSVISKELEKGLEESLTTPLLFEPNRKYQPRYKKFIKKGICASLEKIGSISKSINTTLTNLFKKPIPKNKSLSNDPLKQLINETENNIAQCHELIQDLGKNFINKAYLKFNDSYHTHLFSIPPLGNVSVTPASIVNWLIIYGLNGALILVNLNQKIVNTIPFNPVKNCVTSIKNFLGHTSTVIENMSSLTDDQQTPGDSFVLTDKQFPEEFDSKSKLITKNPDYYKTLQKNDDTNGLKKEIINGKETVRDLVTGQIIIPENNDNIIDRVRHVGTMYEYTNDKGKIFFVESRDLDGNLRHYITRNINTGYDRIIPTPDEINLYKSQGKISPQKPVVSYISNNGHDVSPNIVYWDSTPGANGGAKNTGIIPGYGPINTLWSMLSTVVEPDFKTAFTLPINAYLTSFIYEDVAFIREQIPTAKQWFHSIMSGNKREIKGKFKIPTFDFSAVIGRDAIKTKLMPYIQFIENPTFAIQAGIRVPRGIIFAGEPQTGKTMMAEAFAGELCKAMQKRGGSRTFNFIEVSVAFLMEMGLKPVIQFMKKNAPCLVFCDEFELTGAQRDQNKVLLADFLTALNTDPSDDIDSLVFFLVATNYPENIDEAMQQNGRLGTHIYFETPCASERRSFFMHNFNTANIPTTSIDIEELVKETAACSYGMLGDILSGIKSRAQHDKESVLVTQKHVDETLDDLVRRILVDEYDIPEEIRMTLAARFGAQSFISLVLNPNKKFVGATIFKITPDFKNKIKNNRIFDKNSNYSVESKKLLQDSNNTTGMIYGGFFSYNNQENYGLISHKEKLKLCKIALAGTVGQEVYRFPNSDRKLDYIDFESDWLLALQYTHEIVFNGIKEDFLPKAIVQEKKTEALNLLQQCKEEVRQLLEAHKEHYQKIVELLQKRYIIRASDIKECFNLTDLDLTTYFSSLISSDSKQ